MGRLVTSLLLLRALIYLLAPGPAKSKSNRNFIFSTYMNDGPFEPWEGI